LENIIGTVDVYVHGDEETLYEKGKLLGLNEDAACTFAGLAYEIKLTVEYDANGNTKITAIDGKKIEV